ncbi:MAG TPA: hypothetical protein VF316_11415 [Polyangiaceae bacterium]
MDIATIEASLPWGLHDAYLEAVRIDWSSATATLTVRVMMTERQDMDRRAEITVTGLVLCAIDPPQIDPRRGYEPTPERGLWIDSGEGPANDEAKARLPKLPDGCFLHWFFVQNWNRFIHISGKDAELRWIEEAPVAARSAKRALFAGDLIPDPQ